jgi:hypothetical protein
MPSQISFCPSCRFLQIAKAFDDPVVFAYHHIVCEKPLIHWRLKTMIEWLFPIDHREGVNDNRYEHVPCVPGVFFWVLMQPYLALR